jgi:multidrug efflux pump subunit AcrB
MIIIALIVSYFISVFVLPLVAEYLIRGRKKKPSQGVSRLSDFLVQVTRTKGKRVLLLVAVVMLAVLMLVPSLKLQFFPAADRNQLVLDLTLPSHVTMDETAAVSSDIEKSLLAREEVTSIYRSVGASGFRFYYNLNAVPESPNTARLMINTANLVANQVLIHWIEHTLQPLYPEATLVAKRLGQGPPTPAPIELRLQSDDSQALYQATDQVLGILHNIPGSDMVRSDLDTGIAEMRIEVDKASAEALGLRRDQIAAALFAQTRGLDAGEYRYADDPVTIRVRSESGEHTLPQTLASTSIYNATGQPVPLDTVAKVSMGWSPAVIHHYQGQRTVTVLSELAPGAAYNEILNALSDALDSQPLPSGVNMQLGGDAEGSGDANSAILKTAPLGIMMLLLFMLLEFNSFKRLGIILVTIPLAGVGIIPGLVFSNSPFGFQSLLGVIALTGIVVNNAIVLLDAIDARLKEGIDIDDAVDAAIKARTAPVLLTTVTTVLGLLTLAFSESTLWPPMAWAIISGLLMSTLLTLLVIPILSRTFLRSKAI